MFVTAKNYSQKLYLASKENQLLSNQFLSLLQKLNINHLNLVSVGNSISSGYSKCDQLVPFLMRSNLYCHKDLFSFYSFARIRRNEDANILDWYRRNISHREINLLLVDDIIARKDAYVDKYWGNDTIDQYMSFVNSPDIGFQDCNKRGNTLIIYNGFTGRFTDIIQKGSFYDQRKLLSCFQKDYQDAYFVLKSFYMDNPHTQVYVCGLPNLSGVNMPIICNQYIKKLCQQIPNTVYLNGTFRNTFFYLDGQKEFDVHYNVPEYLCLWNNITSTMTSSYLSTKLKCDLLCALRDYHLAVERISTTSHGNTLEIENILHNIINSYMPQFKKLNQSIYEPLRQVCQYYRENYLLSYACTPRKAVIQKIFSYCKK